MMTCFPPNYNTLCLQITVSITQTYTPPESFLLNPLLPILYIIPLHSQSLMALMCFPQNLSMIQIWIGISDPIPQTPHKRHFDLMKANLLMDIHFDN